MTGPEQDRDDATWLKALSGRDGGAPDGVSGRQAAALRSALERRRARLDAEVPAADEALFWRIAEEVKVDMQGGDAATVGSRDPGLEASNTDPLRPGVPLPPSKPSPDPTMLNLARLERRREHLKRPAWRSPPVWGLAASLVLGATLVYQTVLRPDIGEEQLRMRSGDDRVVVRTSDPAKRASDIAAALRTKGIEVKVDSNDPKQLTLRIAYSSEALAYLRGQRIEVDPMPEGTAIVLVLVPKAR